MKISAIQSLSAFLRSGFLPIEQTNIDSASLCNRSFSTWLLSQIDHLIRRLLNLLSRDSELTILRKLATNQPKNPHPERQLSAAYLDTVATSNYSPPGVSSTSLGE